MIEIPEYEHDPEADKLQEMFDELIMFRYRQAVAAIEAARLVPCACKP